MSTGYLPVLGAALRHGPWIAGLCAFVVTPGALVVTARVLERRWLVPREQFAAVAYGDPLLAVAAGLAVWLTGSRTPHGLTGPAAGVVAVAVMLLFGLAQWRDELRRGYYTLAQAAAPTKRSGTSWWSTRCSATSALDRRDWRAVGDRAGWRSVRAGQAPVAGARRGWAGKTCHHPAAIPSSATRRSTGAGCSRGRGPGRRNRRRCSRRRCAAERFCEVLYGVAARQLALCWYAAEAVRFVEGAGWTA